jgi:sulfite reductase (ferredoxin)
MDLQGVPCPINWARAKARLETMSDGERLAIVTDDARAERDIPIAAETEGWAVVEIARQGTSVRIVVER